MRLKKLVRRLRKRRLYKLTPICVSQAQRTKVFHSKNFLSRKNINHFTSLIQTLGLSPYTSNFAHDIDQNGNAVHTTSYMNTDNLFTTHMSGLREKIIDLVKQANDECGWGFNVDSNKFRLRVAEYHEMEVGGSLQDPHHYDVGSLITVDIMLKGKASGVRSTSF